MVPRSGFDRPRSPSLSLAYILYVEDTDESKDQDSRLWHYVLKGTVSSETGVYCSAALILVENCLLCPCSDHYPKSN